VRLLLGSKGVKPDSKSSGGQTLLSLAAENGHQAVVRLLQSVLNSNS
jgi:ankyrin repeat protein